MYVCAHVWYWVLNHWMSFSAFFIFCFKISQLSLCKLPLLGFQLGVFLPQPPQSAVITNVSYSPWPLHKLLCLFLKSLIKWLCTSFSWRVKATHLISQIWNRIKYEQSNCDHGVGMIGSLVLHFGCSEGQLCYWACTCLFHECSLYPWKTFLFWRKGDGRHMHDRS